MARFYQRVLGVASLREEASHVTLQIGAGRLLLHAIPDEIASSIPSAVPPALRDDAAVKLSFAVSSLSIARSVAAANGGGVGPIEREWEYEGRRYVDGWDPEGNVLQLYSVLA